MQGAIKYAPRTTGLMGTRVEQRTTTQTRIRTEKQAAMHCYTECIARASEPLISRATA